MEQAPRTRRQPRPLAGVARAHQVDVNVPDPLGSDAVPRRADDLVAGQPLGQGGRVAGVQQAVVEERRRGRGRGEERGGTAEHEGAAAEDDRLPIPHGNCAPDAAAEPQSRSATIAGAVTVTGSPDP